MKQETMCPAMFVLMNIIQLPVTQFVPFFHSRHQFVEVVASQQELVRVNVLQVESNVSGKPTYLPTSVFAGGKETSFLTSSASPLEQ